MQTHATISVVQNGGYVKMLDVFFKMYNIVLFIA